MSKEYVSARALGYAEADRADASILISFYGPKGGSRSIEEIDIASAVKLRDDITAAIAKVSGAEGVFRVRTGFRDEAVGELLDEEYRTYDACETAAEAVRTPERWACVEQMEGR